MKEHVKVIAAELPFGRVETKPMLHTRIITKTGGQEKNHPGSVCFLKGQIRAPDTPGTMYYNISSHFAYLMNMKA